MSTEQPGWTGGLDLQRTDGRDNEVVLTGRVTSGPELRRLPSGDEVVAVGISVPRVVEGVDAIPLAFGPAPPSGQRPRREQVGRRLLARAMRLEVGDTVQVGGRLQRRWWAAPGGRRSRIEVCVSWCQPVVATRGHGDA